MAALHAGSVDELRSAVRRAAHESERLSQLAEDLLLIARIDRGKLPLRYEEISANDLFASVVSRFECRAAETGIALRADPANVRMRGDRLRIEQALGNLVDNGLRHGANSVLLTAIATRERVELHVKDTGGGFPPDFLDRAFRRFSRADPARGRGGAGLGLSIVRAVAVAHGGSAQAANSRPVGADVWIELPA